MLANKSQSNADLAWNAYETAQNAMLVARATFSNALRSGLLYADLESAYLVVEACNVARKAARAEYLSAVNCQ